MNYSLTGKSRIAAKNAMQSKTARFENVAVYADREASRNQKFLAIVGKGKHGETTLKWVKGTVNRSKSLKVI